MHPTTGSFSLDNGHEMYARSGGIGPSSSFQQPPFYKPVGISLAIASGAFIGISFVIKKVGLLKANVKYNEEAGEGYGYLKNLWWWAGMTLMAIGELCNFAAYAFVDAILVTPMGALSVVVTTILSAIFLKERLSFVGKVGCFNCIVGSVIIALNAPEQSSVTNIEQMQHYVLSSPVFLAYGGVIVVGCAIVALWAGPRYGKKNMFVYLTICSLIGGLSVVATQGLGAAILAQIRGEEQYKHWFLYALAGFVVVSLLVEIVYLNKALNIFNTALVTPTYYVFFTSATFVTSAVLFRGFSGTAISITTIVMGFLTICSGVVLLQLSKSASDVPDVALFKGDLDLGNRDAPETEPKADSIRGTAAIIRQISTSRRRREEEDAQRYFRGKQEQQLPPVPEGESMDSSDDDDVVEKDGQATTPGSIFGSVLHRATSILPRRRRGDHDTLPVAEPAPPSTSGNNHHLTVESPSSGSRRQFSFSSVISRTFSASPGANHNIIFDPERRARQLATEEERLGLVRGDLSPTSSNDDDDNDQEAASVDSDSDYYDEEIIKTAAKAAAEKLLDSRTIEEALEEVKREYIAATTTTTTTGTGTATDPDVEAEPPPRYDCDPSPQPQLSERTASLPRSRTRSPPVVYVTASENASASTGSAARLIPGGLVRQEENGWRRYRGEMSDDEEPRSFL